MEETQQEVQSPGGSKMPMMIIGVVIILAIVGFAGMKLLTNNTQPASDEAMENQKMTAETTVAPSTVPSTVMAAESSTAKVVTMDAGSFYYSVKTITVKKGEKVKIVMTSRDMMHDLNIDELDVKLPITKSGETNSIEFTADKVGTFEYYCSVGQHRKQGQVGKITVTE
jgi:heme/copper-type cytochrome/quinol oxidase subunit 2